MEETIEGLAAEFELRAAGAVLGAEEISQRLSERMLEVLRANASGRPGPNVVTGNYLSSLFADVTVNGVEVSIDMGSTAPQTNRLEYGFVGRDSLGRIYDNPPLPHFRPTADAFESVYEEEMAALADLDWRP